MAFLIQLSKQEDVAKYVSAQATPMESPFSSSSSFSTSSNGRAPRPAVTPGSFASLLLVLPAAILVGIVYHFIGRFLDLLILFPIVAGACVGGVLALLAKKHKVRSKPAIAILAIVGGLLCFSSRWIGDALQEREEFINSTSSKISAGNAALEARAQTVLRSTYTPLKFFPLYMQAAAKQGVSISSTHSSSSTKNSPITGTAFWILTFADALFMCGAAVAVAWKQASEPFCVGCDSWHDVELTVSRLHSNQAGEVARLAASGEWAGLGTLRGEDATEKAHCDVLLSKCPGCSTGQVSVKNNLNNKAKTLWSGKVSPPDVKQLEDVRAKWLQ